MKTVRIGLVGCGTVGTAFCRLVNQKRELYRRRDNIDLQLAAIAVADPDKPRDPVVPRNLLVQGWQPVTRADDVDLVVELIGGADHAGAAVLDALARDKHVVTANKMLLAAKGQELTELAGKNGCGLGFEAAVGCGIPVIGSLAETLSANRFKGIVAIINGTTNFILSQMTTEGITYQAALALAQERGFAEADPSFDVEGRDAAQKLSILAALAFGVNVKDTEIHTQGITDITDKDIQLVAGFGYVIKLLAIGHRTHNGIELRVHPALVNRDHPLAAVRDEFNALFVQGDITGEVMLYGRGAGPVPTAGAVLSDVVRTASQQTTSERSWVYSDEEHVPHGDVLTGYYMIFPVQDTPGVIGKITTTLGKYGINIASAHAHLADVEPERGIVQIISDQARERDICAALEAVSHLSILKGPPRFYRIEVPR